MYPDLIVLGGTRLLHKDIITCAKKGVLNAHPGLLPAFRGMDVVAWQVYHRKPVGATCHFVVEEPDAGPILTQRAIAYRRGDSLLRIRIECMKMCAELMAEAIRNLDSIVPQIQNESRARRYYPMDRDTLSKVEALLAHEI